MRSAVVSEKQNSALFNQSSPRATITQRHAHSRRRQRLKRLICYQTIGVGDMNPEEGWWHRTGSKGHCCQHLSNLRGVNRSENVKSRVYWLIRGVNLSLITFLPLFNTTKLHILWLFIEVHQGSNLFTPSHSSSVMYCCVGAADSCCLICSNSNPCLYRQQISFKNNKDVAR